MPVIGDVLVLAPRVTAAHRAAALVLLLPHRQGVVVRRSAAWVWTGQDDLRPSRIDLAGPLPAPVLPGPSPAPHRALPVRRTRWSPEATWGTLAGLPVTDPQTTAAECLRFLAAPLARRCLDALLAPAA